MGCDPTTEKVLEGLLPFVDENREERAYRYVDDDTGRRFHIRDFSREREKDRYFLEEHKPIGFWSESQRSRVLERLYRKMKREMTPNRLVAAMQEEERSRESDVCVLYSGGGLGVGSIYYDSLEDCARAIAQGADLNAKTEIGDTALMWAAGRGHADVVRLLLDAGAVVNIINQYGNGALVRAAGYGHVEVMTART